MFMNYFRRSFLSLITLFVLLQSQDTKSQPEIIIDWMTSKPALTTGVALAATIALSATAYYIKNKFFKPNYIACIKFESPIIELENTDLLISKLMWVRDNPEIAGVLLMVESGGGAPGQSELIYHAIREVNTVKPIVVLVYDVMGSGAYLAFCGATIVAPALSSVGCIGVLSTITKAYPEKFDQEGTEGTLEIYPFAAGEFKSIHNPHVPLTDETKVEVQREIDSLYDAFLDLVIKARPALSLENKKDWAGGRSFNGPDALHLGLIDYVGGMPTAQTILKRQITERVGKPIEDFQFLELI